MKQNLIYLDNNATTICDPRVVEAMLPYFSDKYANASSSHSFGNSIQKSVQDARENIAGLIHCDTSDLVFTSGATESMNLGLIGFALANQDKGKHIVTIKSEHKAVLDSCKYLESIGFHVTYLPVLKDGSIDLEDLISALSKDTILVCAMYANNEIGVIHPIKRISAIAHEAGAAFMCDATQVVGKMEIDVHELNVDLMAFSGHKFYGPKGIGALYVNDLKRKKVKIQPLQYGGGHENGLRSGTLNVPAIVGLGKACEISETEMLKDQEQIGYLRDRLESELLMLPNAFINGNTKSRMYNVTNICFSGIDANVLIGRMKNIAMSNGSACTSSIIEPSHVLKAIGLSDDDANASIRFSLGRFNSENEITEAIGAIKELVTEPSIKYA